MPVLCESTHLYVEKAHQDLRKYLAHVHDNSKELYNKQIVFYLSDKISDKTMIHRQEYSRIKRKLNENKYRNNKSSNDKFQKKENDKETIRQNRKTDDNKEVTTIKEYKEESCQTNNMWEYLPLFDEKIDDLDTNDLINMIILFDKYSDLKTPITIEDIDRDINCYTQLLRKFYNLALKDNQAIITYAQIVSIGNIGVDKNVIRKMMAKLYKTSADFIENKQSQEKKTDVNVEIMKREIIIENHLNEIYQLRQQLSKLKKASTNNTPNVSRKSSQSEIEPRVEHENFNQIMEEHERCVKMLAEGKRTLIEKEAIIRDLKMKIECQRKQIIDSPECNKKLSEYDRTLIRMKEIASQNELIFDQYRVIKFNSGPVLAIPELLKLMLDKYL